ncbi:cytidylyltransferase domain-containing protein [Parabacteroides johnsonii]|jgi:spore coat polysaccharide biosynthesis protein SpsF (cytidylyltransferase family)|uniref:Glycosyl transferase family 2 n=2 Tax=Parabacteroides johnsonii TaxID=387661 RepID=A0A9Q5X7E9_9BACT|nr:hypothetical protein [Parabacteroides johnsonii]OUO04410.1 hypothetical protein B5F96_12270 [Parabacteroides johnsonii]
MMMDRSNLAIIIQARMGSTRLPNKMILPYWEKEGILSILLKRIKNGLPKIPVIVATTCKVQDDVIEDISFKENVLVFRGNENDVLKRFIDAANTYSVTKIVRICADNPFLDIEELSLLVSEYENMNVDYFSYITSTKIPSIKTHYGLWGEAVSLSALEYIYEHAPNSKYHEHVTNYIYEHPLLFRIEWKKIPPIIECLENLRLTVDTKVDFDISKQLYQLFIDESLKGKDTLTKIRTIMKNHEEFYELMAKEINENIK